MAKLNKADELQLQLDKIVHVMQQLMADMFEDFEIVTNGGRGVNSANQRLRMSILHFRRYGHKYRKGTCEVLRLRKLIEQKREARRKNKEQADE